VVYGLTPNRPRRHDDLRYPSAEQRAGASRWEDGGRTVGGERRISRASTLITEYPGLIRYPCRENLQMIEMAIWGWYRGSKCVQIYPHDLRETMNLIHWVPKQITVDEVNGKTYYGYCKDS